MHSQYPYYPSIQGIRVLIHYVHMQEMLQHYVLLHSLHVHVVLLVCVCIHTWCACSASLHCTTTYTLHVYTPLVHVCTAVDTLCTCTQSVCMHSSRHSVYLYTECMHVQQ